MSATEDGLIKLQPLSERLCGNGVLKVTARSADSLQVPHHPAVDKRRRRLAGRSVPLILATRVIDGRQYSAIKPRRTHAYPPSYG